MSQGNEKKLNRFKNLAKKKTHEEVSGDVAKELMLTNTETFTNTFTKTLGVEVPGIIPPEPKVKFEKLRKRSTFWMKESDLKIINALSKKLKRPKYEILENAIKLYSEAVNNRTGCLDNSD